MWVMSVMSYHWFNDKLKSDHPLLYLFLKHHNPTNARGHWNSLGYLWWWRAQCVPCLWPLTPAEVEHFSPCRVSEKVLFHLLRHPSVNQEVHFDPNNRLSPGHYLYTRNHPVDYFILLLQVCARVRTRLLQLCTHRIVSPGSESNLFFPDFKVTCYTFYSKFY